MIKNYVLIFSILFAYEFSQAQCQYDGAMSLSLDYELKCRVGWRLHFEDNFDGNALDITKWKEPWLRSDVDQKTLNYHSFDNIEVSNGTCKIIAKREDPPIFVPIKPSEPDYALIPEAHNTQNIRYYDFSSGMLVSQEDFLYGKYEARIRFPAGNGIWPAFWTFGGEGTVWNELDILDGYDGIHYFHVMSIYDWDGDGEKDVPREECGTRYGNVSLDLTQWHTYTCINDMYETIYLFDNQVVHRKQTFATFNYNPLYCGDWVIPADNHYTKSTSTPTQLMNIILNLQIAGPGSPYNYNGVPVEVDASTHFPATMEIDYVRFWMRPIQCDAYDATQSSLFTGLAGHTDINEHTEYLDPYHVEHDLTILGTHNIYGDYHWTAGHSIDMIPRTVIYNGTTYYFPVEILPGSDFRADIKQCGLSSQRITNGGSGEEDNAIEDNYQILESSIIETQNEIEVVPNPSHGIFSLQFHSTNFRPKQIIIYNLLNEIVFEKTETNAEVVNIDLSRLPKGAYIVGVESDGKEFFKKIFIL